ncbi:hypothetical protein GTCCBUS3UF5_1120 [Geobacillus thermoleovorans CCB_US3_UF5]|nr:hypothetical protein GTCCBUS3UF5_1120 [Geobacillus thermoleovorans CCB_US3_UF5]
MVSIPIENHMVRCLLILSLFPLRPKLYVIPSAREMCIFSIL